MKKIQKPDHKAGIWLDQKKALIIHLIGDNDPVAEKINSGAEIRVRVAGETKIFSQYGHAIISDQEKKQHRQKNEREKYLKKIIALIQNAGYLFIFGPSDTRHELINDINKDPVLKKKFLITTSADRMTEKQVIKHVVEYFNGELFRMEKKNLRKLIARH
jgi:hypothetical protein